MNGRASRFIDVFKFELNFHRRQNLVYVLSGVFFVIAFMATVTPNVSLVGGIDNININSPYRVMMTLSSLTLLTIFGAIAFTASAITRDQDLGVAELFYTTPVRKFDYLYGRFFGSVLFTFLLYFGGLAGILIGELMPWLDQERIGMTSISAYLFTSTVIVLPNLFVFSCIFFCIATLTRSTMATYASAVALLMISLVIDTFTEKDTVALTSIFDPFGVTALEEVTRYWTVFEKNSRIPSLEGKLLVNRMLWIGIGLIFLVASYRFFSFSLDKAHKTKRKQLLDEPIVATPKLSRAMPVVTRDFGLRTSLFQYWSQMKLEVRNIVFSIPFVVLLLLGVLMVVGNALGNLGDLFGTAVYPTTNIMVRIINGAFSLSLIFVLIYYAGELMVRERQVRISEILDAMPQSNWVMMAAKFSGLIVVLVSMLTFAMLGAIAVQIFKGFYDIDVLHYLQGLFFFFQFPLYFMVVMVVFFYVVSRNKYFAMFMMVIYFLATFLLPNIGMENYLYRGRQLNATYSDFTGYSQNLVPYLWQTIYWSLFGCLLLLATYLLWPRGVEDSWSTRIRLVRQRSSRNIQMAIVIVSIAWIGTGGYIFYNTNILNEFESNKIIESRTADYEKKYKQYESRPRPVITDVFADVSIYPEEREVFLKGYYEMENRSKNQIVDFHLTYNSKVSIDSFELPGATLVTDDQELGFRIYRFDEPMNPGEVVRALFTVSWRTPGFANNGHSLKVTDNGTFVNNYDFFPIPGYLKGAELQDNNIRRKHELPPVQRAFSIDDKSAWMRNGLGNVDRVNFETIVSTSVDQIAVAPGYLQKEWRQDGRRYFHYKMDAPIWNFYSYMSADYKRKTDRWNNVDIEVYYLHDYNVDVMIDATKQSLDYFVANFSPYQYRQFRILEFPAYQGVFAQSFPNTVPFSEGIGFVADLRDKTKIDYVYYVTAHELAHQWWAHQVLGADVQGSSMIVESLAQYSALMVMEARYGKETMKRFLEFELDRYLRDRGGESIEELPLVLVENQPYIHYRKGSVVLYALQDYIGADAVNRALARFIKDHAFKGPPYPTSKQLVAEIRRVSPPEYQNLITDLFEKIVLYDLKVADAKVKQLGNGEFEVNIDVEARKIEASGTGEEHQVPISTWVDIGIFGDDEGELGVPETLLLEKFEMTERRKTYTFHVHKEPRRVGIDPLNKLIDRDPSDNLMDVGEIRGDEAAG